MAYLTCTNLDVGYAGLPVAQNISFEVNPHDMLCVVGENGAGKSTLIKTLLGLIAPLAGTMGFSDGVKAGEIGYLPQRNEAQRDFPASVWEVVLSGRLARLGWRPFFSREDRNAAEAALARVGALDLRNKPFGVLSGGQQQRVLLARALTMAPKLLVLDEPTTGLDPQAAALLYQTFDALREEGVAIVAVTHDVSEATAHATHVLSFGREGSPVFSRLQGAQQEGSVHHG